MSVNQSEVGHSVQENHSSEALMTPRELCGMLKISRSTLYRLDVPFLLIGACRRYVRSDVLAYMRRQADNRTYSPFTLRGKAVAKSAALNHVA